MKTLVAHLQRCHGGSVAARRIAIGGALVVACSLVLGLAAPAGRAGARRPAVARCTTAQLRITFHGVPGDAGHVGAALRFRNTGRRCALEGYPGMDGVTAGGRVVVRARRTLRGYLGGARAVRRIVLRHGATASALFEGLLGPARGHRCPTFSFVTVTPPNDVRHVRLRHHTLCSLQIHPVVAGRDGGHASG